MKIYLNGPRVLQIDHSELNTYVRYLGHKPKKHEVEDMIWEVDENGDGCINWEEFKTMCASRHIGTPKRQL